MVTSYSYLNQIFYIPNKFDGKTDFGEKYILNENNLSNLSLLWSKYGLKEKEEEKIENNNKLNDKIEFKGIIS